MISGGTTCAYRASDLLAFATALFRRAGGAAVYVQILDPAAFGGGGFVRQTGFIAASCRRNPAAPGVEAVRLPGEQALAPRLQARAAGVRLYPGIMEALAPWAERFDLVAPAPAD